LPTVEKNASFCLSLKLRPVDNENQ
jgi:hypothetical protein